MGADLDIAVRPAVEADAGTIAALRHEDEPGRELRELRAWALHLLRHHDPRAHQVWVAERGGEAVGWARAGYFEPPHDAPEHTAPAGWYLLGVNVRRSQRRAGVARALTQARLDWLWHRAEGAFYFAERSNGATLALHDAWGFAVVSRRFWFPGLPSLDGLILLYTERPERWAHTQPIRS